jgi:hypothetical protein
MCARQRNNFIARKRPETTVNCDVGPGASTKYWE